MDWSHLGAEGSPLRPSSLGKLVKCSMGVCLSLTLESTTNSGAATGTVVHAGIEGFHLTGCGKGDLERSLSSFPEADPEKARRWYSAYAADPTNQDPIATVDRDRYVKRLRDLGYGSLGASQDDDRETLRRFRDGPKALPAIELPVRLTLGDVHIAGTLDQIRRGEDFGLSGPVVADVKTGSGFLSPEDTVAEHQFQQAAYVLAARNTLELPIQPGGIIYIAGYDKPRGRRFIPMGVSLEQCERMMEYVVAVVHRVRREGPTATPSADGCKFCPHKQFPKCTK